MSVCVLSEHQTEDVRPTKLRGNVRVKSRWIGKGLGEYRRRKASLQHAQQAQGVVGRAGELPFLRCGNSASGEGKDCEGLVLHLEYVQILSD